MAVKDGLPYLKETLRSLSEQSLGEAGIIIWDNGSTDGSREVLQRWSAEQQSRRAVLDRPMSLGDSLAAMVELAETEYIAHMDADDVCHPERLELQLQYLESNPEVGVCGSNVRHVDSSGVVIEPPSSYPTEDRELRWRQCFANTYSHPSVTFRREAALRAGNYRPVLPGVDNDFWFRLLQHTRFANLRRPLLDYRKHQTNVSVVHKRPSCEIHLMLMGQYVSEIFPGLDATECMRVIRLLSSSFNSKVSFRDLGVHKAMAETLGIRFERNAGYFKESEYYRRQRSNLQRRALKSCLPLNSLESTL